MVQITKGGRANRAGRSVRKTSASVRNRKTRRGRACRSLEVLSCWPGCLDGDPILSVIRSLRQRRPFYGTYEVMPEANSRSEEHTSELQSQSNLVCRLLLE